VAQWCSLFGAWGPLCDIWFGSDLMQRAFHLLLVEDNAAHAKLAMMAIRSGTVPVTVDWVADGEQALAYLHRHPPHEKHPEVDLILLDLKAPRVDGFETLRQIKADPELRAIPVVVLSASLNKADMEEAYRNYANSYLVKPLDFDEFQHMISDLVTYWGTWNQRHH